ncbi:MAG: hypothetical protein AABW53_00785, partial [Nanoarchaeota archaeon]
MSLKNDLSAVSFIALTASLTACSNKIEPIIPVEPVISILGEYGEHQEYTLVKKVSLKEAGSLEELLLPAPNLIPDLSRGIRLNVSSSKLPEILYHLKIDSDNNLRPLSIGSCFLINEEGFFLTAQHVFERYLRESKGGEVSSLMLLYDPISESAATALPLIYSVEKDILLGKADISQRSVVQSVPLSDNNSPFLNNVYSVAYANIDYLSGELLHTVLSSGAITVNLEFVQRETVAADIKNFGVEISIGRLVDRRTQDEKLGQQGFLADMVRWNSGSPGFDLINNLVGVVNEEITV